MKHILSLFSCLIISVLSLAQTNPNHIYVNGYYDSNGNYVSGYYRTAPNNTINDNFSTYPNVNPYTGEIGYIQPESESLEILKLAADKANVDEINRSLTPAAMEKLKFLADLEDKTFYFPPTLKTEDESLKETFKLIDAEIESRTNINFSSYSNLSYTTPYTYYEAPSNLSAIAYHDKYSHSDKLEIERFLKSAGFFSGTTDGIITDKTINAIKDLQRFLGVSIDGKMGENTIAVAKAKL